MWLAVPFYVACLLIFIQILACRPAQSPTFLSVKCFSVTGLKTQRGLLSLVGNAKDTSTKIYEGSKVAFIFLAVFIHK